ncbi:EscU/YscU/HrcU family type III secretion system export apparatus switch protein [Halanaerobium sp. Z-7514]|uniref:EscU/YscU/HrcU family type III secretion system export apparatus switch protein n=1 Tax=Halanaerobium polyolivorans TaxID=2886943 RepID=A0AAW4X0A4_9FIRM|nr:EscU/YscU/HrcU family type III secretion system export apparatus switch protein [Halanaerobium polyolivorans]MCC3145225.1 EscU/YscU/HrcU family type III secretion system export apparatus switch protein [Halanaerobium polyolivorans]
MSEKDKYNINLKNKEAVALKYNHKKDNAPKITAKGRGLIAQKILEKAREAEIPIENNQDLVKVLAKLEIGDEIPEELYLVIAEMLSFFYDLNSLS